jgi:hypothetical protein
LFKAWDPSWEPEGRVPAWVRLKAHVIYSGAKVLLGAPVSCSKEDDDMYWSWTRELMKFLGPDHILGLGIGNELELLQFKGGEITDECVEDIWENGYFWRRFTDSVADMDSIPGFDGLPVTSVFGGYAIGGNGVGFMEQPRKARVNSFMRNATEKFGQRYAFTWNIYPYFNGGLNLYALDYALCWNEQDCFVPMRLRDARKKQQKLTGKAGEIMWVGETGWSYPKAASLQTSNKNSEAWSSRQTFARAYQEFLAWDMDIDRESGDENLAGPDVAFYFTVRDSLQFGKEEHFGLIDTCSAPECKLHGDDFHAATYEVVNASEGTACSAEGVANEGFLFNGLANNYKDCQDLCTQNPDCRYFSFWSSSKWCRHSEHCCLVQDDDPLVTNYMRTGASGELCPPPESDAGTGASPVLLLRALFLCVYLAVVIM